MQIDRRLFMEQGYLILRGLIPQQRITRLRTTYAVIVERQKALWAAQRRPDQPPGGEWDSAEQPRLHLTTPGLIDPATAAAVDFWLDPRLLDVANQLLAVPEAGLTEPFLMCNPNLRDFGPATWHRDLNAAEMAPLQYLIDDFVDNGPRYVQWNIPLYDDEVLWIIPGSHRRLDRDAERLHRHGALRSPLPGGMAVELRAGDAVIYSNYLLHWGSNYSRRLRRTIHGGHALFTAHAQSAFLPFLGGPSRERFASWNQRTIRQEALTEMALRSLIHHDVAGYVRSLDALQFGISDRGKLLVSIYLAKVVLGMALSLRGQAAEGLGAKLSLLHPISLKWGPRFHQRFTSEEVSILQERFHSLESRLRCPADDPMSDGGYYYEQVPGGLTWSEVIEGLSLAPLSASAR